MAPRTLRPWVSQPGGEGDRLVEVAPAAERDGTGNATVCSVARNHPGDLNGGDATVNDRLPSANDDSLPLATQARQEGGAYRIALFGLMLLLGVAVLLVLVLNSGMFAGT
jgi:hypothetical protein